MRHAVLSGPGRLRVEVGPRPIPTGRDVLVRVEACGVCGSDRAIFAGHHPVTLPAVLGHEYAGTVVECGPDVTMLGIGDRVTVDPNITCGVCTLCRRGLVNLCLGMAPLGIVRPGGFAEFSIVPEVNAYRIAGSTTFDEAAMVEPLACCVRGISQADVRLGDVVAVIGAGPIGLLLVQLARLRGAATIISSDPIAERRVLALTLGADVAVDGSDDGEVREAIAAASDGLGADVTIEASGRTPAAQLAVELVRAGGSVVWFGACPQEDRVSVPPFRVNDREITIRGSNVNPFTQQTALALIERGRVRVGPLISDHIGLEELAPALGGERTLAGKAIVHPAEGK